MPRLTGLLLSLLLLGGTVLGCKTVDNANKMMNEITKLAQNMNGVIDAAKGAATTITTANPLAGTNLPALPASATGGKDLTKPQSGKSGSTELDVNGDGTTEQVNVFTADSDGTTYLSWEQDGVCYLSWKDAAGKDFLAFSACQNAEGYYTCEIVGETADCSACNLANECAACDMQSEESACAWPGSEPAEDVVSDASYEDTYVPPEDTYVPPEDTYLPDTTDECADDGFCNENCADDPDCNAGDPCGECADANCATEDATCASNADCLSLFECLMGCADEACGTTCQETYPNGLADLEAYLNCEDLYCADPCK